jgi:hypothetical protein
LTDDNVEGALVLMRGGAARIQNGGAVVGLGISPLWEAVTLACWNDSAYAFSGKADFDSVASGAAIAVDLTNLDGVIAVSGNVAGAITIEGDVTGEIEVAGEMSGDVSFRQLFGKIRLRDAMKGGSLTANAIVKSTGRIIVADMISDGANHSSVDLKSNVEGSVDLQSGIKANQEVKVGYELNASGSIDLNSGAVAGTLDIDKCSGVVSNGGAVTGTVTLSDGETSAGTATFASVASGGTIRTTNSGNWSGDLTIAGVMSGAIDVTGNLASGGEIDITGNSTGDIGVDGDAAGDIDIGGSVTDDISVGGDVSGTINIDGDLEDDLEIAGDVTSTGGVSVGGDVEGDIDVAGSILAGGDIHIGGKLASSGRIRIDEVCDGNITIDGETSVFSLVLITDGLDDDGTITVNADGGDYDHDGTIHLGEYPVPFGSPLDPVTFDGSIVIQKEDGGTGGGDVNGYIRVVGCHDDEDYLDICVCGDVNGSISITQTDCENQVPGYQCSNSGQCNPDE